MVKKIEGVYLHGKRWWIRYSVPGKGQQREPGGQNGRGAKTQAEAANKLKHRQAEILTGTYTGPGPDKITVGELLNDLLAHYRAKGAKSLASAESSIKNQLMPTFEHVLAKNVTTRKVDEWIAAQRVAERPKGKGPQGIGYSEGSIYKARNLLVIAFGLGYKQTPPKVLRLPRFNPIHLDNARQGFIELAGFKTLRSGLPQGVDAPGNWQTLLTLAYACGARSTELRMIQWPQVDWTGRGQIVLVRQTAKNGHPRAIPLNLRPELYSMLHMDYETTQAKYPDCPWVFHRQGKRLDDPMRVMQNGVSLWDTARKAAGLHGLLFHDLRRTAVRNKSDQTRARILSSALALFRKHGFEQATMRQIAEHAGVAVGAAYYYFDSKDALVMAFYDRAQQEMEPLLVEALAEHKDFERRLRAVLEVKFDYFGPNRSLLGALSAHADPGHPLSPFSSETRAIRERDSGFFAQVLDGSGFRVPADLKAYLPRLLWMYQMGLILFWVYDRSAEQARTRQLVDKSLPIIVGLIKLSSLPFLRPVRKRLVDLLTTVYSEDLPAEAAPGES